MAIEFEPIVNLQLPLYIDGLNLSVASNTVLAIAPGQARDSMDQIDMPVGYPDLNGGVQPSPLFLNCPKPLYINTANVGANGLDKGALAASSSYIVYLIADASGKLPVAGLMSLYSNQYPLLPFGYSSYRRLGFISTTAGTLLDSTKLLNERYSKSYFFLPYISELSGGNAVAFTSIDLSAGGGIPTTTDTFVIAYISVIYVPASVGNNVQFRPTGSTATSGLATIVGQQAGIPQTECLAVMTGVSAGQPKIDYKTTNAGDSVSVLVEGYSVTLA